MAKPLECSLCICRGSFRLLFSEWRRGMCVDVGRTNSKNKDRPDISGGASVARLQSHQGRAFQTRTPAQPPSWLEFLAFVDQEVTMIPHRTIFPHRWAVNPSLTHGSDSLQLLHFFHPRIANGSRAGSWEKNETSISDLGAVRPKRSFLSQ